MKHRLHIVALVFVVALFASTQIQAQAKIADTVYFTKKWEICEKPLASFFRAGILAAKDNSWFYVGSFTDYAIPSRMIAQGSYSMTGKREGLFKYYYDNSQLRCVGNYADGVETGNWQFNYPDGSEHAVIKFPADPAQFSFIKFVDHTGKSTLSNGTGKFLWETAGYDSSIQHFRVQGAFADGNRTGEWEYVDPRREGTGFFFSEIYKDGQYVHHKFNGGSAGKKTWKPTAFSFTPRYINVVESMQLHEFFRINGDSMSLINLANYLIQGKPTEISYRHILFDNAFRKILNILDRYVHQKVSFTRYGDVNAKLEFMIGSRGVFENISFKGTGIDSSVEKFFQVLLSKFKHLELPGFESVGIETNFTLYCYVVDYRAVLPPALRDDFNKRLVLSFEPREKIEKYLLENKATIRAELLDRMLNPPFEIKRHRKQK